VYQVQLLSNHTNPGPALPERDVSFAAFMLAFSGVKKQTRNKCPTCKREGDWFAGKYGPFCSRRCKLIDLGKWLGEEHMVSQPLRPEHMEETTGVDPTERSDSSE
jgi:hypothetical protein